MYVCYFCAQRLANWRDSGPTWETQALCGIWFEEWFRQEIERDLMALLRRRIVQNTSHFRLDTKEPADGRGTSRRCGCSSHLKSSKISIMQWNFNMIMMNARIRRQGCKSLDFIMAISDDRSQPTHQTTSYLRYPIRHTTMLDPPVSIFTIVAIFVQLGANTCFIIVTRSQVTIVIKSSNMYWSDKCRNKFYISE